MGRNTFLFGVVTWLAVSQCGLVVGWVGVAGGQSLLALVVWVGCWVVCFQ